MTKQEQIDQWNARPIQAGDRINVEIDYVATEVVATGRGKSKTTVDQHTPKRFANGGMVLEIFDTPKGAVYAIKMFSRTFLPVQVEKIPAPKAGYPYDVVFCKPDWVKRDYSHCGSNPFKAEPPHMQFYNYEINSLLSSCGYGRGLNFDYTKINYTTITDRGRSDEKPFVGCTYGGCNFDPYVIDANGNKQYYQRGLVWTVEQKQQLIESIYNWIEIGKFVFRYNEWERVEKQMAETGHGYSWDCVDGKQRLDAIISFIKGDFADLHGNYWSDLSPDAQRHVLGYNKLSFAKMEENTKDADVIRTFLTLNFTGVPMSKEHIAFVQSIKM